MACNCKEKALNHDTIGVTSCFLILTEACNLRCVYCFEHECEYVNTRMSEEVAYKTVDYLIYNAVTYKSAKAIRITLFGGEPMTAPDLMEKVIRYAEEKSKEAGLERPDFAVITNATIYNEKIEKFLEFWVNLQGPDHVDVQLSLDGIPEIQNSNRPTAGGQESSKLVERAVPMYKDFFIKHNINLDRLHVHCVLAKRSIPKMAESYDYFHNTLGLNRICFAWCYEDKWDMADVEEFDHQLAMVTNKLIEITTNLSRFPFDRYTKAEGCGSGKNMVSVSPQGLIYPCHRFYFYTKLKPDKDLVMGSVLNERGKEIDPELHNKYFALNPEDVNPNPCQVCIACNFEQTGDMSKQWDGYMDVEFQKRIDFHRTRFTKAINNIQTKNIIENHEKRIQRLENLVNRLIANELERQGGASEEE